MKTTLTVLGLALLVLATGCRSSRYASDTYYDTSVYEPPVARVTTADADRALADLVRGQFNRYGDLAALAPNIQVSARNGMVTLTGNVPSDQDRRMIIAMVESTLGVVTINDQLRVSTAELRPYVPTGRLDTGRLYPNDTGEIFNLHVQGLSETDRTLAQRVLDGLRTDAVVTSMLPVVNIHVTDGRVILRGSVLNEAQRRSIVSAVKRAAGANNVYDELRVR